MIHRCRRHKILWNDECEVRQCPLCLAEKIEDTERKKANRPVRTKRERPPKKYIEYEHYKMKPVKNYSDFLAAKGIKLSKEYYGGYERSKNNKKSEIQWG